MRLEYKKIKNIGIYLISEFLNKGLSFLLIPIFANLLTPDEFSHIGAFTVIYTFLIVAYGLNFNASIMIIKHEKRGEFESILISNLIVLYLWMIFLSVLIYVYRHQIALLLAIDLITLYLAAASAFFSILYLNALALYQSTEKSLTYSILSISKSLITFSCAIFFTIYLTDNKFLGYMYGQLIGALMLFAISIYLFSSIKLDGFDIRSTKYMFIISIPLIPHTLSGIIYSQYDRIIVQNYLGNVESGVYYYSVSFLMIIQTFIAALNVGWSPMMLRLVSSKSIEELKIYYNLLSKIVLSMVISIIIWVKELVEITSSRDYIKSIEIIPIFCVAGYLYFIAIMYININLFSKKTFYLSLTSIIVALCSYCLNVQSVVVWGSLGSAYVSVGSVLILLSLNIVMASKFNKDNIISIKYFVGDLLLLIVVFSVFNIVDLIDDINFYQRIAIYLTLMTFIFARIVYKNLSMLHRFH